MLFRSDPDSKNSVQPTYVDPKTRSIRPEVLLLIVLIACVWQLAHGGGYKSISFVIGILAVALIGPDFVVDLATAMPDAAQMQMIKATIAPVLH